MPKRKRRKTSYYIQAGRIRHKVARRHFTLWLANGLITLAPDAHNIAHPTKQAILLWERDQHGDGVLHVLPTAPPGPSMRTNAQVIERHYIYADAGQIRISREDRQRFAAWRARFGKSAEQMIAEYIARKREFDMCAQYGWDGWG